MDLSQPTTKQVETATKDFYALWDEICAPSSLAKGKSLHIETGMFSLKGTCLWYYDKIPVLKFTKNYILIIDIDSSLLVYDYPIHYRQQIRVLDQALRRVNIIQLICSISKVQKHKRNLPMQYVSFKLGDAHIPNYDKRYYTSMHTHHRVNSLPY